MAKERFGNSYKFDNLNGGRMRPEYVEENMTASQDAYDHTLKPSEGFSEWLRDRHENQPQERREMIEDAKRRMFPDKGTEMSAMDQAIHETGYGPNYYRKLREDKQKAADMLFPDAEIERRREENENKRHPMDVMMRQQLAERKRQKGGF